MTHARVQVASDLIERFGFAEPRIVAHAGYGLTAGHAIHDEDRLNQLRDRESRLRHQIAKMRGLTEPQMRPGGGGVRATVMRAPGSGCRLQVAGCRLQVAGCR